MNKIVRVLVTAPFRYNYGGKSAYFRTGQDFYLNLNKEEEVNELAYLLSVNCPYSSKLYINRNLPEVKEVIESNKKEEVNLVNSGSQDKPSFTYEDETVINPDSTTVKFSAELKKEDAVKVSTINPTVEKEDGQSVEVPSAIKKKAVSKTKSKTKKK